MSAPRRLLAALAGTTALAAAVPALAAAPVIESGPSGATNDPSPAFAFRADGPATCRVDEQPAAPCASPATTGPLADGPHVFVVEAGGELASRSFTIDTVAPVVALEAPGEPVADTRATVRWTTGAEEGLPAVCSIAGGQRQVCGSPWTTPHLRNGEHPVTVEVEDAAGNQAAASAMLTVAAPEPETTITAGPEGATIEREPAFGLKSTAKGARFECRLDGAAWAPCLSEHRLAAITPGEHLFEARALDAAGNVDATPAERRFHLEECRERVEVGAVDLRAACFRPQRDGTLTTRDPLRLNGIAIRPLAGQEMRVDPERRRLAFGRIQLRAGSITLYQGDLSWTVPEGDRVTLARIDLSTFSMVDGPAGGDSEAALDLQGDDRANAAGLPLTGEATLDLDKGRTALSATVELPKVLTDAEGRGLTGTLKLSLDNERSGLRLDGASVTAPLAFAGKLELHDLYVRFNGDADSASPSSCNENDPGLRWAGGATAIQLPMEGAPRLTDVGIGFGDGRLEYAKATWAPGKPGHAVGSSFRIHKLGVSVCTKPSLMLQGRIGFSAGRVVDGVPGLDVPDAAVTFRGGDAWSLSAEAAKATVRRGGKADPIQLSDLRVGYRSGSGIDVSGRAKWSVPVEGDLPFGGKLKGSVEIDAGAKGFYATDAWNLAADGKACFSGRITGLEVAGVDLGKSFSGACAAAKVVVSSVGVAVCGTLTVNGKKLGGIGVGYRWSGDAEVLDGGCDVSRYEAKASSATAVAASVRDAVAAATAARVRSGGRRVRRGPAVRVRGRVVGTGRRRAVVYDVRGPRDVRVRFAERGGGAARFLPGAARPGHGRLAFRPAPAAAGRRTVQAVVERDGLPVAVVDVDRYTAPPRPSLGRPAGLRARGGRGTLRASWRAVPGAARYAVRIALPDGRRLVRLRRSPALRLRGLTVPGEATVRVVALRADASRGPAAAASSSIDPQG